MPLVKTGNETVKVQKEYQIRIGKKKKKKKKKKYYKSISGLVSTPVAKTKIIYGLVI